jgi:hypothetical protein
MHRSRLMESCQFFFGTFLRLQPLRSNNSWRSDAAGYAAARDADGAGFAGPVKPLRRRQSHPDRHARVKFAGTFDGDNALTWDLEPGSGQWLVYAGDSRGAAC